LTDTSPPYSVVSQFAQNKLTQFLVQNGKKFVIPGPTDTSLGSTSDITPDFCSKQFTAFGDRNRFSEVGGFDQLNAALRLPMVLVMSIWDDVSDTVMKPQFLCTTGQLTSSFLFRSTTPTCSGSTPSTRLRRRASPALPVVTALRTLASPLTSSPSMPTGALLT
jgi:hypothetical protein